MDDKAFHSAYNAGRNGANYFTRYILNRDLRYSDGVKECFEAGCFWLLDIVGTECTQHIKYGYSATFSVKVENSKAYLRLEVVEGTPVWTKEVEWTDMPEGEWSFFLSNEGLERPDVAMILFSEY